ncbi:hypothetical protein IC608_04165 [Devosia sp. PTR5]|uniref:Chromosomal replication initiator protein DnaA domain-containing protein n=1 Tax=Devosia oryzisoli TaxID=2774138 RepID=A0A927ISB6_9HYPH|nr:hypothetical protein [Devosia oryzisoli]MBD8064667.1 hypothetical protein [Devosia oryzisoli]
MCPPDNLPRQLPLDLVHEPSHAEDDFLVGTGNALAHARILAWPHWPDGVTVLLGPAASGKSHLARIFALRSQAEVATSQTLRDIGGSEGRGAVVVEDVDRAGYEEHELFHLLNQALRGQRTLLFTARDEVANWPIKTADVRSRFRRAPVFRLEVTDDIELSQMFVKLFGDRQVQVDPKVIGYVVPRMERSPEEVAALVELMDRLALARRTAITRAVAAEALSQRRAASGEELHQDWDMPSDE